MRTNDECYEYVLKRVGELEAQKRKRRAVVLKAAAPVCGIAVVAGTAAALRNGKADTQPQLTSDVDVVSGETVPDWIDDRGSANSVVESAPQYVPNTLNIGELEIAGLDDIGFSMFAIPSTFYEMTRDEVLDHFGLSAELDLSDVVDGLHEIAPKESLFNPEGKHGFSMFYFEDENGNGEWEPLAERFDNEKFEFESADGESSAVIIFDHSEQISWFRSGMFIYEGDNVYSSRPFYALPTSTVAGVEMRIAHRSIGGYYAEFRTSKLSVGLSTNGLSEDETVRILESLAVYTAAANDTPTEVTVGTVEISYPEII